MLKRPIYKIFEKFFDQIHSLSLCEIFSWNQENLPLKKGNFTLLHPPFLFYPEISGNRRKNGCRVSNRIEIRDKKGQKLRRLIGEGWRRLPSNSVPSKGPETSFRVEFLDRLTVDSRSWLSNEPTPQVGNNPATWPPLICIPSSFPQSVQSGFPRGWGVEVSFYGGIHSSRGIKLRFLTRSPFIKCPFTFVSFLFDSEVVGNDIKKDRKLFGWSDDIYRLWIGNSWFYKWDVWNFSFFMEFRKLSKVEVKFWS